MMSLNPSLYAISSSRRYRIIVPTCKQVKIEMGGGNKNTYILTRKPSTPPLYSLQTPLLQGPHKPVLSTASVKAMVVNLPFHPCMRLERLTMSSISVSKPERLVHSPNLRWPVEAIAGKMKSSICSFCCKRTSRWASHTDMCV
jgi:hypothetical protein